ncbi:F0F1 ATP synthase subunit gamma [Candidatus Saganbacteria bacterium]|nr:F0F1 ATP synthase subunit gamma [Candidatus Saganbacteria bacterium]
MSKVIEIRNQLAGIVRINSMMQAMQVVAVSQLKQAQNHEAAARHFRRHYDRLAARLRLSMDSTAAKTGIKLLYVVASERGFCGDFNDKIVAETRRFLTRQGDDFQIIIVGGRGSDKFRLPGMPKIARFIQPPKKQLDVFLTKETAQLAHDFTVGEISQVSILYNEFKSMLAQIPRVAAVLPFTAAGAADEETQLLCEPNSLMVKKTVAAQYLKAIFYDVFMQSQLGEVAARLITMRGATENSKEMIDALRIKLNKARQAMITLELSEIVSSFEILKEGEE